MAHVAGLPAQDQTVLEQAQREIQAGVCSCVVIRGGAVLWQGEGRGVKPIKQLYESAEGRALLAGALLADKIVGKAAAMLLVLAGVRYAYGETMSQAALDYLQERGIPCGYGRLVPFIQNRDGSGLCPMEQAVLAIEEPKAGYEAIVKTIKRLMAQPPKAGR